MISKSPDLTTEAAKSSPSVIAGPSVTFESVTFSDGTAINLEPNDIVVLVGPNNSGKSLALRELEHSVGPASEKMVVKAVSLRRIGTSEQVLELLSQHGRKIQDGGNWYYRGLRFSVSVSHIDRYWENQIDQLRSIFCMRIATETRITDSNQQGAISVLDQSPQHPIHLLYIDDRVERRISSYFRRAFGEDLIVFHAGGSQWPLLVGKRPVPPPGQDRVSVGYTELLQASTVPLQLQGDGMRSFASVVLHMLAPKTQTILLLDEPEAFLHPPQARLLGEFIANEKLPHAQLIVATHSADVLQGLLNAAPEHLRILRIQREGSVNRVKELDKSRARAIAADPLMKFSSVMSGVFHERVIICESDADCMFYSAILDIPDVQGEQQPDVLFVHAGGKHRIAALADALRALDVAVDVVADMDVLNDEAVLERIAIALGGDWPAIQAQVRPLKAAIEQHKPWLTSKEVVKGIQEILINAPATGEFPKSLRAEIDAVFRKASPWDAIKDAGEAAIPAGQPMQHYHDLQRLCNGCGLWIVPVGELEGFCKSEGGHGPRWVQKVIEKYDFAMDAKLALAREFMRKIWNGRNPTTQKRTISTKSA